MAVREIAAATGWQMLETCPACCSSYRLIRVHREHLALCRCHGCGVVFLNPRPAISEFSPGHLKRDYLPTLRRMGLFSEDDRPEPAAISHRYRKLVRITQDLRPDAPIVDIGCGVGLSMLALQESGIRCSGIDVNPEFVDFARKNLDLDVRQVDVTAGPLPERFAGATMNSVLEHLVDPIGFLRAVRENVLTPGAFLVLTVPNLLSLEYVRDGEDWRIINNGHLWYFTEQTLSATAEAAGFAVERVHRTHQSYPEELRRVEIYLSDFMGADVNVAGGLELVVRAPA